MEKSLDELVAQLLDEDEQNSLSQVKVEDLPQSLVTPSETIDENENKSAAAQIAGLTTPQKMKLAMTGNKIARQILIRDISKQIPLLVLNNPAITDDEICEYAKNTNLDAKILRAIGSNPIWMKSYAAKIALLANPKAPVDVSVKWIKHLMDRDLNKLARSKNIPSALSTQCRRLLEKRAKK